LRNKRVFNQHGFLTVDFLFAVIVCIGCLMLLLRVSISLVSAQVAQYVVYSAARAHSAGDVTKQDQIDAGEMKYKNLLKDSGLIVGLLKPGESIQKTGVIGNFNNIYNPPSQDGSAESGTPFIGARSEIKLPRLGMTIPFMGKTSDGEETFKANVSAMLFREPSSEECQKFFKKENRYDQILNRNGSRFGQASSFSSAYVPIEDSGC
jgi:hypothetical protein